ncbi:hypothetical protein [Lichenicoccus sp.]|uniref:hypothetical protein n=1 Tax=Lichenicoccus sp. TaxID=2781899 RepID=UPI003D12E892
MPRSLKWTLDLDVKLERLIDFQGATIRCAAKQLGVSRSFAQRRAKLLAIQSQRRHCSEAREAAGVEPLRAGHPITWSAICSDLPPFQAPLG